MPLELFDHRSMTISREVASTGEYHHCFGGSVEGHGVRVSNAAHRCHIVYVLDTLDPLVPFSLPGIRHFPLVYDFRYASEFIYCLADENKVEVITPTELEYEVDFPYPGYPDFFPEVAVSFDLTSHNGNRAADALKYQGIFGLDHLSASEMSRAVEIAKSSWHPEELKPPMGGEEWNEDDLVRSNGHSPFIQDEPSDSCENPQCTADVEDVIELGDIELPPDLAAMIGKKTLDTEPHVIRKPTLHTIALHQPDGFDEVTWGDPYVQLIFQLCTECGCVTVNNQCT